MGGTAFHGRIWILPMPHGVVHDRGVRNVLFCASTGTFYTALNDYYINLIALPGRRKVTPDGLGNISITIIIK
jgi:hypothetical protein